MSQAEAISSSAAGSRNVPAEVAASKFLTRKVIAPVAEALGSDEPELSVSLVGSQALTQPLPPTD